MSIKNKEFEELISFTNKGIEFSLTVFTGKDKETNSFVSFIPSLNISGYGETEEESDEMLRDCSKDYFDNLSKLSVKNRNIELVNNGWKKTPYRNKEFRPFIDSEGRLKNFNFDGELVRHNVNELVAA